MSSAERRSAPAALSVAYSGRGNSCALPSLRIFTATGIGGYDLPPDECLRGPLPPPPGLRSVQAGAGIGGQRPPQRPKQPVLGEPDLAAPLENHPPAQRSAFAGGQPAAGGAGPCPLERPGPLVLTFGGGQRPAGGLEPNGGQHLPGARRGDVPSLPPLAGDHPPHEHQRRDAGHGYQETSRGAHPPSLPDARHSSRESRAGAVTGPRRGASARTLARSAAFAPLSPRAEATPRRQREDRQRGVSVPN